MGFSGFRLRDFRPRPFGKLFLQSGTVYFEGVHDLSDAPHIFLILTRDTASVTLSNVKELRAILDLINTAQKESAVLATLVSVAGSSYRRPGARLLLIDDLRVGSISGGCLEEDVIAHARHVAKTGAPKVIKYDTTSENELVWGVGLGCHGIVHVLIEPLPCCPEWAQILWRNWESRRVTSLAVTWAADSSAELGTRIASTNVHASNARQDTSIFIDQIPPPTRLLIFGAGDDAQPLHRIAAELGWDSIVADPRPAYATTTRFPSARQVVSGPAASLVARTRPDAYSVAVVMTHHYVHDVPILRDLLPLNLPYIGLLGPKKRGVKILGDLAAAGLRLTSEQQSALHSPIGLDIGAETPEEVAISIVAEIRTTLSGRSGGALKNRERPIHD